MKSKYENRIRKLLKTKTIPWVVGYICGLYQDYEIEEDEENYLYTIADPEEKFNSPFEYYYAMDDDSDFTEEEVKEWEE